jgi:glycosyltransferase involved in cell wall biosynthesis
MARIIGHMVTRNERNRYLADTLNYLHLLVDDVVAYDDQSDDGTLEYLRSTNISCVRRPDDIPPFAHNESRFREAAWRYMERAVHPEEGDWILCIDADEALVPIGTYTGWVQGQIDHALAHASRAVRFKVEEIFGYDEDGWPLVRKDGYWAQIHACRLVEWRHGGYFELCHEGGGSVPNAWTRPSVDSADMAILHYGYARADDRETKHERYSMSSGHNPQHVASILQPGRLQRWAGMDPIAVTS